MDSFDYELELSVRYRDLDTMGHVNNAVYATYMEQARDGYIEAVTGDSLFESGAAIAMQKIEYHDTIDRVGPVTVAVRATDVGTSSLLMEYEIRADGDVAATGETLLVTVDPETGESRPMPDDWREAISDYEDL